MNGKFAQRLNEVQLRINDFLSHRLQKIESNQTVLWEAMRYGLLLGGKRIRPFLVYATGRMLGAPTKVLDYAAAAVESIHAYSLIHDDLPAMDDDNLRRGQPTCHVAFDEATAILAGDALQTLAFEILTEIPDISDAQKLQLIRTLAQASGANGMCLGQSLDLISEHKSINLTELELIHRNKTGALLTSALQLGFICSPHFSDHQLQKQLTNYAMVIGLAFQVQDDILDIEGESAVIGKTIGADLERNKSTYPKLLGLEGAKQKAQELYQNALATLDLIPFDTAELRALAEFIVNRKS
ncbi:(2E,6E)-farnesyl diphosphate synthase [Rodentibacter caecimuris]|uniref:Geranyl transferase n=1 Tax=Rodentibacter caecimuris TaxID=1796644 RepID=A0ABX3KWL8_9PAST|nr:geranyl transferase [Rodentibacter heylii]